jgi:hypothetical protein
MLGPPGRRYPGKHSEAVRKGQEKFNFLATVSFFRAFRPLPPTLGPVDDEAWLRSGRGLALGEVTGLPLGTNAEVVKGGPEDRQQPMNPIVHLRLTQGEEFAHDGLQRIGLEVDQDK